jgi:large subunit ribosomal protein L7Ae
MNVPFAIVKGKSRLGTLTNKKTCSVVALTAVNKEDEKSLKTLQDNFTAQFNENVERKWGGGIMGLKTVAATTKRAAIVALEEAKKAASKR